MTGIYKRLLSMSLLGLLTSCYMSTETTLDTFCANAFPVWLAPDERLDDVNADKVLAMNNYGKKHCNWK